MLEPNKLPVRILMFAFFSMALNLEGLHANPCNLSIMNDVDKKKQSAIVIEGMPIGRCVIALSVNCESSKWKELPPKQPFTESSGQNVEGKAEFTTPDGQPLELQVGAQIEGDAVLFKSSWNTSSAASGLVRAEILLPDNNGTPLAISVNGKPLDKDNASGDQAIAITPKKNVDTIEINDASSGKKILAIGGPIVRAQIIIRKDGDTSGLSSIRIFATAQNKASFNEATELKFKIHFPSTAK